MATTRAAPPTERVEERVGYQLKRAQHALRTAMDDALRDLGLTAPQYAALAALEEEPGLSNAELARRSFVTPQTMNGILANLERSEFVERRAHPSHGRILEARLTGRGRSILSRSHGRVLALEERMLAGQSAAERRRLAQALRRCADVLGADTEAVEARL